MRCYLMMKGHIAAVEFLTADSDDKMVAEARAHFARRTSAKEPFDGFEVWDHARHVYSWPEPSEPNSAGRHGEERSGPAPRERREA